MKAYSKCRRVSSDRYDFRRLPVTVDKACNCEECLVSRYTDPNVQGKHAPKSVERNDCDGEKTVNPLRRKSSPKEAKVKFMSTEEAISLAKSGICERPRTVMHSSSHHKQKSLRDIYNHGATECCHATIGNQQAFSPVRTPSICVRETPASTSSEASKGMLLCDKKRLLTDVQTESCAVPMPLILVLDRNLPNGPAHEACWKGMFDVFPNNSHVGVQAHFSSKVLYKAYDIKNHMPEILKLDMVCSKDVWPKIFQQDLPTAYDVALYFFPCESSERYISLVEHINSGDFALKACITDVELLIFTSERLFEGPKVWLLSESPVKNYLWGVFVHKHKSHNCYKQAHTSNSKMANDIEEETNINLASNRRLSASYEGICHPKVQKINESMVPATPIGMIDDLRPSYKFDKLLQASYENNSHPELQKIEESTVPATPPGFLLTDACKRSLKESRLPASSSPFLPAYDCKDIPKETIIPAAPPGFLLAEAHKENLSTALLQDKLIKDDKIEEKDIKPIGVALDNKTHLKSQKSRHLDVPASSFGFHPTNTCIKNLNESAIPASPSGFLPTCPSKLIQNDPTVPATPPGFLLIDTHTNIQATTLQQDKLINDGKLEDKDIKPLDDQNPANRIVTSLNATLGDSSHVKSPKSTHLPVPAASAGFLSANIYQRNGNKASDAIEKNKWSMLPTESPGFHHVDAHKKITSGRSKPLDEQNPANRITTSFNATLGVITHPKNLKSAHLTVQAASPEFLPTNINQRNGSKKANAGEKNKRSILPAEPPALYHVDAHKKITSGTSKPLDEQNPGNRITTSLNATFGGMTHLKHPKSTHLAVPAASLEVLPTNTYKRNGSKASDAVEKNNWSIVPAEPPGFHVDAHKKITSGTSTPLDEQNPGNRITISPNATFGGMTHLKNPKSTHLSVPAASPEFLPTNIYQRNGSKTSTVVEKNKWSMLPAEPPGFCAIDAHKKIASGTSKDGNSRGSFLSKKARIMTEYEVGHHKSILSSSKAHNSQLNILGDSRIAVKKENENQTK